MRTRIVQTCGDYSYFEDKLNKTIKDLVLYWEIIDIKYSAFYNVAIHDQSYSALIIFKAKGVINNG